MLADQDKSDRIILYIFAAQASKFYHGFYNALDILSPNIKMLSPR